SLSAGRDWRGPIADRLYLPTADGGGAITDAVTQTYNVVNTGRALAGLEPLRPKNGARFHFELPGSVQGFQPVTTGRATLTLENVSGHSRSGERSLALHFDKVRAGNSVAAETLTFIPPADLAMRGYSLIASPTLYPGQTVRTSLSADTANPTPVKVELYLKYYGTSNHQDQSITLTDSAASLPPGESADLRWTIPNLGGDPIAAIGVALSADRSARGSVYLDYLTWDGAPDVVLGRPADGSSVWSRAWVDATDEPDEHHRPEAYRVIQDYGRGLLIQGTRDWTDYQVSATLTPHMAAATGIAARVQGLRRYYALLLRQGDTVQLIKSLDGERVLASAPLQWEPGQPYTLQIRAAGRQLQALVNGQMVFIVKDEDRPLLGGAVALVVEEGRVGCEAVEVHPLDSPLS
ncbi:MAG TPA: hypothetical protein VMT34_07850, partial [Aggregatilineales bacterium]|nr:hypothetical protein [Aggregatilineales bacterium]